MKRLEFRNGQVFRKSFERKNLTYLVIREEDKKGRLLRILNKMKGPGIVYVRNRKETRDIATFLSKNKIPAGYYHAGLDAKTRDQRQQAWLREETRIVVATNAFGMGIDKPNVRLVVHLDLPDSVEAYFQEAGRAGRDEKQAYAVLLYEQADLIRAKQNLDHSYPPLETIRSVYQALGNYLQLPVGSGKEVSFDIDVAAFADQYRFPPVIVFNALKFLEKEGYLMLTEGLLTPSRIYIKADKEELYRIQVKTPQLDRLIKGILRSYSGVMTGFSRISEPELARRLEIKPEETITLLKRLEALGILDYQQVSGKPQVIFTEARMDTKDVVISAENYRDRLREAEKRLNAILHYAETGNKCRSQQLLAYFGDRQAKRCGRCDVCLARNKINLNEIEFDGIVEQLKPLLRSKPCTMEEIVDSVRGFHEDKVIRALQWLHDNDKLEYDEGKFSWR
jgi:ATP-dependent DNA helicase RecQ